jgi:transposase
MASEKAKTRRQYSAAMKAQVMAQCNEPGASVAKVAMAHGINANVVHRWRQLAREEQAAAARAGEFIALPLASLPAAAPAPVLSAADIRIELCRGPLTMIITWPASAAADFAAWSRELLR